MNAIDTPVVIDDAVFNSFRHMLINISGIELAESKKALVAGRLSKRIRDLGLDGYEDYLSLVQCDAQESQIAIDLLTTNETHFFRETPHFSVLRDHVLSTLPIERTWRFWSAASSTGQEAYSLAMLLQRHAPDRSWEIIGSDISSRVVAQANRGLYPIAQTDEIPLEYLKACCLRGTGASEGTFVMSPELRRNVTFLHLNLNVTLPDIGLFDVIFLRNILIYFNTQTRQSVVGRVLERLRPGGWIMVGHSESLTDMPFKLKTIAPSVYRKA